MVTEPPRTGPTAATGPEQLTTDPPLPPGAPDVDDLVGDPVVDGERAQPDDEDVTEATGTDADDADTTVTVEPPD